MTMDALDRRSRLFDTPATRRAALSGLLSCMWLGTSPGVTATRRRRPNRLRRQAKGQAATALTEQAQPQELTLTVFALRGGDGEFSASGAFADEGVVTSEPRFSAGGTPAGLIIHATEVFTSELGTFTVKRQVKVIPTDEPGILAGTGTWVIISGTGAYAELHGQGTVSFAVDENPVPAEFTFTFTGRVHGL